MNLNATLIAQLVVFFILVVFTMKFVWPPIVKALDERAKKVADGLAAADKAKADLAHAATVLFLEQALDEPSAQAYLVRTKIETKRPDLPAAVNKLRAWLADPGGHALADVF